MLRDMGRHAGHTLGTGVLVALLLLGGVACGDDDDAGDGSGSGSGSESDSGGTDGGGLYGEGSGDAGAASEPGTIAIQDFAFPDTVEAGAGETVTVTNNDDTNHTVTADDGAFDVTADAGQETEFTAPSEAGEYGFHCEIHPSMTSTLVVT